MNNNFTAAPVFHESDSRKRLRNETRRTLNKLLCGHQVEDYTMRVKMIYQHLWQRR